jgi:iron only hydrogenase large subunit-like protein
MSHILSAESLNDYIAPSVACIKPIEPFPSPEDASLEHEVILDGTQKKASGPTQISLTDCLACSGCVTTAEAVLISLQSHTEVLTALDSAPGAAVVGDSVQGLDAAGERKIFVASVSPQTRASLAAVCGGGTTEREAGFMLERFLREELAKGGKFRNGFTWVVDTNSARDACLVLGAEEVLTSDADSPKPIITSSCPGWVCYAEKSHPYVLSHLSKVKSPQALMGTMLKTVLSRRFGVPPSRIWHLAIMPCFDKKLEASREELMDKIWDPAGGEGVRDVDCVITSKEIFTLAEARGIDIFGLAASGSGLRPQPRFPDQRIHEFLFPRKKRSAPREGGTSGGNLFYILQAVCSQNPGSKIEKKRGRNADVVEYLVNSATGHTIFKAARTYGFQNIQNLVRKMKPAAASSIPGAKRRVGKPGAGRSGKLDYAYVEVMACPGGCSRGGGQVNVDDPVVMDRLGIESRPEPHHRKEWFALVDEAYYSGNEAANGHGEDVSMTNGVEANGSAAEIEPDMDLVGGISPSYIRDTLAYWSASTGIETERLALTSFREVISDVGKEKTQTELAAHLAGKIDGGW